MTRRIDRDTDVTVRFRMNGVGNAFLREPDYDYPGDAAHRFVANTSGSLLVERDGELRFHLLFDCGLGVVDSLLDAGITTLTHVCIGHNHADHVLELDRLFQGYRRAAKRAGRPFRVPLYCTRATREAGPDRFFGYLDWERVDVVAGESFRPQEHTGDGRFGNPGLGIDLCVTPVSVYHGNPAVVPDPVIWAIDFDVGGTSRRIVVGWDFLHFVPPLPDQDLEPPEARRYAGPEPTGERSGHPAEHLAEADLLILEGNTLHPNPATGHTSITANVASTISWLNPTGPTWIVHYSGMEPNAVPRECPLSDAELTAEIRRLQDAHPRSRDHEIVLARPGDEWNA